MKMRVSSLALLLLAAVISQGSAQDKCGLITMASELGNVDMPSDVGVIADALSPGGDNPENPFVQIRNFRITCAVADTEPDTYQFLSVVVSLTCEGAARCVASQLGGEGDFTSQFELQCSSGEWVLGDDGSAAAADAFTDPADGTLTTPTNRQCGLCYSNQRADTQLDMSVISYNNVTHCASCDSSCQSEGAGLCTSLGAGACCSFYHDAGSGFMCVDMCPAGFSPNDMFFCIQTCPDDLVAPADGTLSYSPMDPPRFEGTVATYDCDPGFTLIDGTIERTCTNGSWTGSAPICQIADCGTLSIDDGTVTFSQATAGRGDTELGAVATYTCEEKFALNGDASRTCQEDSNWSGSEPKCELCSLGCLRCEYNAVSMVTECLECEDLKFVISNGRCVDPGCPTGCLRCEDNAVSMATECLECEDPNFVIRNGECVECPTGCLRCQYNTVSMAFECLECQDPKFIISNGECVDPDEISGDPACAAGCIAGIVIGVLLAVLLLIAIISAIIGALYYHKKHPKTELKDGDAEGLSGIAKDNPTYVDPQVVEAEIAE